MKIERLPLNALRAFAEAIKDESFKSAAYRLGVTPGAVSRQIKQLEERLGVPLFERHANGVRVNRAGRLLAEDVQAGLARIASGVQLVTERSRQVPTLLISAPPSFLQLWLLPRLIAFEAQEDQIEISLDADPKMTPPLWQHDSARISLRYGRGPWEGVRSLRLFDDMLFPVCAPRLLDHTPVLAPRDLLGQTLLTVDWRSQQAPHFPGWRDWFKAVGLPDDAELKQRQYSLYSLALDQAMAGRGVMLASYPVVADRLASGVLTRPFGTDYALPSPFTYDLVLPATGDAPPEVARFIDWLMDEAAAFRRT